MNDLNKQKGLGKEQEVGVSFQDKGYAFGQAVSVASLDMQSIDKVVSGTLHGAEFKERVKKVYSLILEVKQDIQKGDGL